MNRKNQDYADARRGVHNPVRDDGVHEQREDDYKNLRRGKHTNLADDDGVSSQGKRGRGY